ncbi:MAG: type II toxin-antitoxin system prevent-host-death family antitoxin [Marinilabiliaceae bacterium]|nr:type II toxin-antitoxin system prevent-host-death family antitoxin [Marinilabiliaceae bacterium]
MEIATYTAFRQNLKRFMDKVLENHTPLFITRAKGDDVVVLAKSDYESMQETLHLLSSPKNAARIASALEEYEQGKGQPQKLIEE